VGRLEEIKNKTEQYCWYTHKIVTIDDVEWLIDEVEKRENYWVDKHLNSLGENIEMHKIIDGLKRQLAIKEEDYYNKRDEVNRLKENAEQLQIENTNYKKLYYDLRHRHIQLAKKYGE
jgi:hypothetical protein